MICCRQHAYLRESLRQHQCAGAQVRVVPVFAEPCRHLFPVPHALAASGGQNRGWEATGAACAGRPQPYCFAGNPSAAGYVEQRHHVVARDPHGAQAWYFLDVAGCPRDCLSERRPLAVEADERAVWPSLNARVVTTRLVQRLGLLVPSLASGRRDQSDSAVFLIAARVRGMPLRAASVRSAIWASAPSPNLSWNLAMPPGRNSHDSVTWVPPSTGVKA